MIPVGRKAILTNDVGLTALNKGDKVTITAHAYSVTTEDGKRYWINEGNLEEEPSNCTCDIYTLMGAGCQCGHWANTTSGPK